MAPADGWCLDRSSDHLGGSERDEVLGDAGRGAASPGHGRDRVPRRVRGSRRRSRHRHLAGRGRDRLPAGRRTSPGPAPARGSSVPSRSSRSGRVAVRWRSRSGTPWPPSLEVGSSGGSSRDRDDALPLLKTDAHLTRFFGATALGALVAAGVSGGTALVADWGNPPWSRSRSAPPTWPRSSRCCRSSPGSSEHPPLAPHFERVPQWVMIVTVTPLVFLPHDFPSARVHGDPAARLGRPAQRPSGGARADARGARASRSC